MNNRPKILIIAPHGYCADVAERTCDTRAAEIADNLAALAAGMKYDVKLFQSDVLRIEHDYNRKESFDTPWRQSIRDYIELNSKYPIIIYEIHSYPKEFTEFDKDSQMALLAINEYYDDTKKMYDYLRHTGIRVSDNINRTRVVNLMVDTTKYNNIKHHYLLEFNEDKEILTDKESDYAILNVFMSSIYLKNGQLNKKKIIIYIVLFVLCCMFYIFFMFVFNNRQAVQG
jgi:hypothetical protein